MARIYIGFILCLLLIGSASRSTLAVGDWIGYLKIVYVNAPIQVPENYEFSIVVVVEYAFHSDYNVQVALFEGTEESLGKQIAKSSVELLSEGGTKNYTFSVRSPSTSTNWRLVAVVFFMEGEIWHYFTELLKGPGIRAFSVIVSNYATIIVKTPYPGMNVNIDGRGTVTGPDGSLKVSLRVLEPHMITVPEEFGLNEGSRAVFVSWDDGYSLPERELFIEGNVTLSAKYLTQHYLRVISEVGAVQGEGWYDEGSVAVFSATTPPSFPGILGSLGAHYVFEGWRGDLSATSRSAHIVMDRPHLVEAVWRTDFGILYPLVIVALALSVTLAVVLLVVRKKLRRETAMPGDETSEIEEMGEEKHCYECGRPLLPDARFCDQCGAEQMRKEKA